MSFQNELENIVADYRRISGQHERTTASAIRRQQQAELSRLEGQFEALLAHWVTRPEDARAWREHLHGRAEAPFESKRPNPPMYVGKNGTGTRLRIALAADDQYEVALDGKVVDRFAAAWRIPDQADGQFQFGGHSYEEIFESGPAAGYALIRFAETPMQPPWASLDELYSDGLVDETFALTARGRRFLSRHKRAERLASGTGSGIGV